MNGNRPRAMTPEDLTRLRFVSDPDASPDGGRVALVVTTLSEEQDEYLSNIWVVETSGGEPRRFTTGPKRDTSPRWSPDGTRLAFLSERHGQKKPQLYVMPAAGGEPLRLTSLANGVRDPAWSPDGRRIAFVSRVGGEEDSQEEEDKKPKPARLITNLKYKFNGEGFTYDRRLHIFVVSADGGEATQLTDGDYDDMDPAWSPAGGLIAFASARHPERDYDNAADVWVVSASGGEPRQVTDTAGPASHPAFSPDGRTIAYLGHRHLNEGGRNVRLFVVPVEDGAPQCLTEGFDRSCTPPLSDLGLLWAPDGRSILVTVPDQGAVNIYQVAASGAVPPEPIIGGERQITKVSASRDGQTLAFAATDPLSPPEVFVCQGGGTGERRLTDLNKEWKGEVALSRPERVLYQREDYDLDCWVMKPFGHEPGQRYPALLNIHGGPHTQYGHTFFDEFQMYAGAGYVVIYTNPRGSEGYGETFRRAVIGDWGGGDYDDAMAGLDMALESCDFIDPERLGVMGGSYGGYLTSWMVGRTHRFKAACSERAVNNLHSMFGTSDIGHLFQEMESGYAPWENLEWYTERSPLTHAPNIQTPLLILHSEEDLRCPMEQAEQLFVALKKLRKEVLFVRFPQENHELSRSGRPRHRLGRFRIILDWFNLYLHPQGYAD